MTSDEEVHRKPCHFLIAMHTRWYDRLSSAVLVSIVTLSNLTYV